MTELVSPSKAEQLPFSLAQLRWLSGAQLLPTVLRTLIADPVLASVSLTDEERLRTNPPGQLIEPFQIEQWWVVVRVESYTPAVLNDVTRMAMARELFEEWLEEEVRITVAQLAPQLRAKPQQVDVS